jgi:hypothetical protein
VRAGIPEARQARPGDARCRRQPKGVSSAASGPSSGGSSGRSSGGFIGSPGSIQPPSRDGSATRSH